LGADALLTGHCGPKAFHVLTEAGVTIYAGFEGTVLEAVSTWRDGALEPLAGPDREAHH
jgi:predicted Fe-Mo cluster-binding NifX family protein